MTTELPISYSYESTCLCKTGSGSMVVGMWHVYNEPCIHVYTTGTQFEMAYNYVGLVFSKPHPHEPFHLHPFSQHTLKSIWTMHSLMYDFVLHRRVYLE